MTTTSSRNTLIVFLLLLAAIAATLPLVMEAVAAPAVHAIERHGYFQASIANQCKDDPSVHVFVNHSTGRTAYVCLTEADKWGILIEDKLGGKVTSFLKNRMNNFAQVARYLNNTGYTLLH